MLSGDLRFDSTQELVEWMIRPESHTPTANRWISNQITIFRHTPRVAHCIADAMKPSSASHINPTNETELNSHDLRHHYSICVNNRKRTAIIKRKCRPRANGGDGQSKGNRTAVGFHMNH